MFSFFFFSFITKYWCVCVCVCVCSAYESGQGGPTYYDPVELQAAADAIRIAVQQKVSTGARLPATCQCRRDIFLHWFMGCSVGNGVYDLYDLPATYFPRAWDRVVDADGQGLQVNFMKLLRIQKSCCLCLTLRTILRRY